MRALASLQVAQPDDGALVISDFTIWGVDGSTVTEGDFSLEGNTLVVNTDKHFAIRTADQTIYSPDSGNDAGRHTNPTSTRLRIPEGQTAHITLAGVGISADDALDIQPGAVCHLVLADGSRNSLYTAGNESAIHNPTGATLTIDDEVANKDSNGGLITPENGAIPRDLTLADGRTVKKGDPLSTMDSDDPGHLLALVKGGGNSSPLGGHNYETGGALTINGGIIAAYNAGAAGGDTNCAAGIGGGGSADGTSIDEWITINGGRVDADVYKTGYGHGAGIGGGNAAHTGNIRINGGYTISTGGSHGSGFGAGCEAANSMGYQIVITGGTLIPSTIETPYSGCGDIGAPGVDITITGGSVGNGRPGKPFNFVGSAHNEDGEKLRMVEVDLMGDVGEHTYALTEWELLVGNAPYPYGAPAEFDKGHLYLWLPEKLVMENEICVEFTYEDTDNVDVNGNPKSITPKPLFRPAGDQADNKVRRYVDFDLPDSYNSSLVKNYDGLPFDTYDLSAGPIQTAETPPKTLNDASAVQYAYQRYDKRDGTPLGQEVTADSAGNPIKQLPADAGTVRFTLTSTQYSKSDDPAYALFKNSYWGHRAVGWYEIKVVPSAVTSVKAAWGDGSEVADPQDPAKVLDVEVDVTSGTFADGTPTATTCKAPEGRVQLYVDGKEAGEPVAIVFGDASSRTAATDVDAAADGDVVTPAANARVTTDADGREHTVVSWSFPAGDLMAPGARHTLTARYLPSKNYLPSANPEEEETPESQVAVKPDPTIAPIPKLAKSVANLTHPDGPTQPGDRLRYRIEAANTATGSLWTQVVVTDPLPACLDLDPDSVKLTNTWEALDAKALTQAAAVTASDVGRFSIGAAAGSGRAVLTVPAGAVASLSPAVVEFECVVKEGLDLAGASADDLALGNIAEATGTRPNPDDPDGKDIGPMDPDPSPEATPPGPATVAPADPTEGDVAISKSVENLKHPDGGATEVGDRLLYTVELENRGGADTALYDAVISDPLPAGIELVPGTIQLAGPASDAEGKPVPDTAYDTASRTLAVAVGDLYGGQKWTLTFECEVTAEAVGADIANIAFAHGTPPSENPGRDPQKPGTEPGEAARPPAADDEPEAASDPVSPPEVLPADPAEGDVSIAKTVANLTRDDGTTHVGDTLRYEIALANSSPGTGWVNAVIRDDVPAGVEPVSGTATLTLADGTAIEVDDAAYDPATRILAVAVGRLYGGQEARLAFEALVTADAVGADIGNVATGYGTPPSQRDPDAPELVPGTPFSPAEGWDAYEARHDVQRVRTDPVYPEGVTNRGGVIDDGTRPDETATIRHRLAQTGDALLAAALMPAACALAAGAALLASRRRTRRAR